MSVIVKDGDGGGDTDPVPHLIDQAQAIGEHAARLDALETFRDTTNATLEDTKATLDNLDDRISSVSRDVWNNLGTPAVDTAAIAHQVKDEIMAELKSADDEVKKTENIVVPPAEKTEEENPAPKKNLWDHLKRLI